MSYMRHLALVLLLASCADSPDRTANLCDERASPVRMDRCADVCKPPDGSPGEVCGPDMEVSCLDECLRCNPHDAWCPR